MIVRHGGGRAFTLAEVVMAVSVASVAFLSSLSLLSFQAKVVGKTQERIYVNRVLESRLEEMRDLTFAELEALRSPISFAVVPDVNVYGKPINASVQDGRFRRALQSGRGEVRISSIHADLKRVEVEVSWNSAVQGNAVTMKTATYITRDGLNRR